MRREPSARGCDVARVTLTGVTLSEIDVHADAREVRCPRCGYDQRGIVAVWTEICPLDGTCAECGFTFEWRELLDERLVLPRWCVETRRFVRAWPRQFIATTARCWLSPLLWRRLQAFHPINQKRLVCWLATWLALFMATIMLSNGVMAIGAYQSMSGVVVVGGGTVPISSTASVPEIFLHAMLFPLSDKSIGKMTAPALGVVGQAHPQPRLFLRYQWRRIGVPLLVLLAIPMTCTLMFAALPVSRKRDKVRSRHIARVGLYSCGLSIALACGLGLWQGLDSWRISTAGVLATSPSNYPLIGVMRGTTSIVTLFNGVMWWAFVPATIIFWWAAAKHYLRMQHALAVGFSVAFVGMLAPVAVAGFAWYLFDFRIQL